MVKGRLAKSQEATGKTAFYSHGCDKILGSLICFFTMIQFWTKYLVTELGPGIHTQVNR
jgi:hypothetical protein